MRHAESDLQIRCIKWFRYQYPSFARLLEHPKNEGCGDRRRGAIAKAEGVQPGVADLVLHVPATYRACPSPTTGFFEPAVHYCSLGIEMKTRTGRQSEEQKAWQQYFEAAGGRYVVIRSYEDFVKMVEDYMRNVPADIRQRVQDVHTELMMKAETEACEQLRRLAGR